MKSAFKCDTAAWQIKWPQRISRHDLVYLSPPGEPMEGIALGNGDVGVLVWCESSKLVCALNKCDLWDDAKFTKFTNWKASEEDASTTLRHAGRLIIDFKVPVFDAFYLKEFNGRLNLSDASFQIYAKTIYGEVSLNGFVESEMGVFCIDVKTNFTEEIPCEAVLERYGSRTFSHWYRLINRDAKIGSTGTQSFARRNGIYIQQELSSGQFTVGCQTQTEQKNMVACNRIHSRAAMMSFPKSSKSGHFKLYTVVTSPVKSNSLDVGRKALGQAQKRGWKKLLFSQKKNWKEFWLKSLMECGDDYLDNLWHLTMYYANASQRGEYPGRFISGLWNWNRDAQPWNFYFHWNQQQVYWPLNAAGHHELVKSYLDYRFNALPYSCQTAKYLGTDGAFVSDVTERRGYNSFEELKNHTPVAQIAMDFWRQYTYTGDIKFLRGQVIPYMVEAAKYFESLFVKECDGKYHAACGTGYEGWIKLKDSITELVYAKILFTTACKAVELSGTSEPRTDKWREIAENLAEMPVIAAKNNLISTTHGKSKLKCGLFRGDKAYSNTIFASGTDIKTGQIVTSICKNSAAATQGQVEPLPDVIRKLSRFEMPCSVKQDDLMCYDGIFPWCELSAVFPSGLIGLNSNNSKLYKMAVTTTKLFSLCSMGWDITPIVLARLGLREELAKVLREHVSKWQFFRNGWGHYGPLMPAKVESSVPFASKRVLDTSAPEADKIIHGKKPEKPENAFEFRLWPFRHMGMEAMSVLACAMNESLLQSHDGIIRAAPAATVDMNGRFTLHACGGFVVSAQVEAGKPCWLSIKSIAGNLCRIVNPWANVFVYTSAGEELLAADSSIFEFQTVKGRSYMCLPNREMLKKWQVVPLVYTKNTNVKASRDGSVSLGLPRMF